MCGICGVVGPPGPPLDREGARRMRDVLAHRGPDGAGERDLRSRAGAPAVEGWFGHRRLAVLDLTDAAGQPIADEDGAVVLTYNGEIYNFRELRAELAARGHRFRSTGDTEVLLRAYEEWGEGMLRRLEGMFALAVFDARTGHTTLARDRSGKKPLFYTQAGGRLTFASEIKGLRMAPWLDLRPDLGRLPEFLTYGYVPPPFTMYEGVLEVPPASVVVHDGTAAGAPRGYWDWPTEVAGRRPGARDDLDASVRELLEAAVARRMVSDVPLGALLSGGVDSSLVVALMARHAPGAVHTFSIGFPEDASFDERSYARLMADRLGTRHTEFAVRADAVALLDALVWHHDQPFHDSSAIPTYIVCKLAREHVTVVLNGDGGDEVFAGYDRFAAARVSRAVPPGLARAARRATTLLPRDHGYHSPRRRAERFLELADRPVRDRYQSWIAVFTGDMRAQLLNGALTADPERATRECERRAAGLPDMDQILYTNFKTYLPGDLAVKMDRMSMAHGLEARSPFLDTALIERMAHVPASHKIGLRRVKPVLRRAFWPTLPAEIWNRKKHGFGVPMGRWMRGELGEVFRDEVLAADARVAPLIDMALVRRLHAEQRAGEREHGARLWTLLTLERWLRAQEAPPPMTAPAVAVSA